MSIREFFTSIKSGLVPKAADYAAYCEKQRRDEAAKAWRKNPSLYQPRFTVSQEPVCPYCAMSLGDRKPPSRRSKFSCRNCGNVVYVDPWHRIFPSVYLDAKQGLIARCLGILDKSMATAGKTEDFWWAAQQKDWLRGKEVLTGAEAGDVLWTLMNYNVTAMRSILPKEERPAFEYHASELQSLMARYRDEEKHVGKEMQAVKVENISSGGKRSGKVPLDCPYCGAASGKVAKPSRRSKRKCKSCGHMIHVDPVQCLYPTPFLTERKKYLVDALTQLDRWIFTDGSIGDFKRVMQSQGKAGDLGDPEVAEVIRALIVAGLDKTHEQAKTEHAEHKRRMKELGIGWDTPSRHGPDETLKTLVQNLLREFDDEVSRWD